MMIDTEGAGYGTTIQTHVLVQIFVLVRHTFENLLYFSHLFTILSLIYLAYTKLLKEYFLDLEILFPYKTNWTGVSIHKEPHTLFSTLSKIKI